MSSPKKRPDDLPRELPAGSHWLVQRDMEKCSLCEVCTKHCPPGALEAKQEGALLFIVFHSQRCDGCGECLVRCPEDASLLGLAQGEPSAQDPIVLVRSQMLRCKVCDAYFAPQSKLAAAARKRSDEIKLVSEECPLCRRTEMVARFIEDKRVEVRGMHARYVTGRKWHWKPVVLGEKDGPPCWEILVDK